MTRLGRRGAAHLGENRTHFNQRSGEVENPLFGGADTDRPSGGGGSKCHELHG